jgi:hypothetical protein
MGAGSGVTKTQLDALITSALAELDTTRRQALWTQILTAVNVDAVFAPLTFMTSRAVVRPEVAGFAFGAQQVSRAGPFGVTQATTPAYPPTQPTHPHTFAQFDFPLHNLELSSPQSSNPGGLSQGAIVGIAIAAAIVGGAVIAGVVVHLLRRSGAAAGNDGSTSATGNVVWAKV